MLTSKKTDSDPLKLTYSFYIKLPQSPIFKTILLFVIIFQTIFNLPLIKEVLVTFNSILIVEYGPMFLITVAVSYFLKLNI